MGETLDQLRYEECCNSLGLQPSALAAFPRLVAAYSQPHRAYHNARHIAHCLDEFEQVAGLCRSPHVVEFALWFHDAIYDPRASDNERRSADWAHTVLASAGAATDVAQQVRELILSTTHAESPEGDACVLTDVDLAILGQDWDRFAQYDAQIRREYAWVPDQEYRVGRRRVLESFLQRETIYSTSVMQDRYEERARSNLARANQELQA